MNNDNNGVLQSTVMQAPIPMPEEQNGHLTFRTIEDSINYNFVHGLYRVTSVVLKTAKNAEPYVSLRLSDATGDINAILWPERQTFGWTPPYLNSINKCLFVSGKIHYFNTNNDRRFMATKSHPLNKPTVVIDVARPAQEQEILSTPALQTLPRLYCPNKAIFEKLIETARAISCKPLQRFVCRVLNQDTVCQSFLSSVASTRFHHSYPGGLLEHSVEVACIVNNIELYRSPTEKEVAIVAALFHDIGKVRSYERSGGLTLNGRLTDHHPQTLEICAEALSKLEMEHPELAEALRHIWTCYSPGSRHGRQGKFAIAHLVNAADRISAEFGNESRAFANTDYNQRSARIGQVEYMRVM